MTDPLLELETLLDELPAAIEARQLGEALAAVLRAVGVAAAPLSHLEAMVPVAALDVTWPPRDRTSADKATGWLLQVAREAQSAASQAELRELTPKLSGFPDRVSALEAVLCGAWQERLAAQYKPFVTLAEFLGRVLEFQAASNDMSASVAVLLERTKQFPPTEEDLREVTAARVAVNRICEELSDSTIGLAQFLLTLVNGNATLGMLTPELQRWLADHGAAEMVGLTLKVT